MNHSKFINIFDKIDELSAALGTYVLNAAHDAVNTRGRFTIALSGGSMISILANGLPERVDGKAWHIFWADERCVPLTSDQSNYALARKFLFSHINTPEQQIYAINDSLKPTDAAMDYQGKLAGVFGGFPDFDLILLGLGEDGHTASLFPGKSAVDEKDKWVAAIFDSPKPPPQRITLSLPVINNAHNVAFVATGKDKADIISRVLKEPPVLPLLPAQMVKPSKGKPQWFICP